MTSRSGPSLSGDVGVEQQQRDPPDLGPPHLRHQLAPARQPDRHLACRPVGLTDQRDRQPVGVQDRVGLLLPSLAGQRLPEVAAAVEQPHADDRHSEVRGRLEVVAGEDAQAARVLRENGGDAELRGEIGDRARHLRAKRLIPPGLGEVGRRSASASRTRPTRASSSASSRELRRGEGAQQARRGPARPGPTGRVQAANRSREAGCQDQRRLVASSPRGASGAGRTVRTVNRRIALTRRSLSKPDRTPDHGHLTRRGHPRPRSGPIGSSE